MTVQAAQLASLQELRTGRFTDDERDPFQRRQPNEGAVRDLINPHQGKSVAIQYETPGGEVKRNPNGSGNPKTLMSYQVEPHNSQAGAYSIVLTLGNKVKGNWGNIERLALTQSQDNLTSSTGTNRLLGIKS